MESFLDNARGLYQQLQKDWNNFEPNTKKVFSAFPDTPDGALQNVFGAIFQFAKKYRDIIEQRRREKEEYEKFAQMGWLGGGEIDQEETTPEQQEKPKAPRKLGILDQLIEGVIRGDFGLDDDNVPIFQYQEAVSSKMATAKQRQLQLKQLPPTQHTPQQHTPQQHTPQQNTQLIPQKNIQPIPQQNIQPDIPQQGQSNSLDDIDDLLNKIDDDFGFGSSYADDLGAFGGEDVGGSLMGGSIEDDLDALLGGDTRDYSGFTIDQLLA